MELHNAYKTPMRATYLSIQNALQELPKIDEGNKNSLVIIPEHIPSPTSQENNQKKVLRQRVRTRQKKTTEGDKYQSYFKLTTKKR